MPLAPAVTVIHGTLLTAVHGHPSPAVTVTVPAPPPTTIGDVAGEIDTEQPESWLNVTVRPATVAVPLRAGPVFGSTWNCTAPLPVPLPPLCTRSHGALAAAVHAHASAIATLTAGALPADGTTIVSGLTVASQPASCTIVKVWPATAMVPVRPGPLFAATANCTVPFPDPFAPDVMLIHDALGDAVHAQPAPPVTAKDPVAPAAGAVELEGAIPIVHPLACVTVKVLPAIVTVPCRSASELAATTSCTVPFPVPLAPDEIPIHDALLDAVHAQPAATVTATDVVAPPAPALYESGAIEYEHPADCVTVKVWPAAVMVPEREGPVFAAAEYRTVPLPLPVAPPVTLSQDALLEADHPQPSAVRTSNDPFPPPAGADADDEASENEHPCPWFTVKVRPAIVMVPAREGPVVAFARKATLPLPLPLAPCVIEIHDALLDAVQAQPPPAVTETVPVPPAAGTD